MTLGRRLGTQLVLLLACLALTAAVGLSGIRGLRQDFSVALDNYERLRQLYQIGFYLQSARMALTLEFSDPLRARLQARRAEQALMRVKSDLPISPDERDKLASVLHAAAEEMDRKRPSLGPLDVAFTHLEMVQAKLRAQIVQAQTTADARKQHTLWLLAAVAGGSMLASVVLALLQFRAVMRPLGALTAGVQRVAGAKFDPPIELHHADREFTALASDFNQMSRQLESMYRELQQRVEAATRSLVQSERLAGVGMLAAGVAHEINNPLAIITGRIELVLGQPVDAATRSSLQIALDEAFQCKQIIDRLLTLSRGPSGRRTEVRLDQLASAVTTSVRDLPGAAKRTIKLAALEPVTIRADDGEIRQVLLNLLINAVQATAEDGTIEVSVQRSGSTAELTILDNGRGMEPGTLERLFEPFFSTRPGESRGTGLGLAITRAIVEAHGGTVEASSDGAGRGSRFVVRMPLAGTADAAA
jgi:signal transduction histidine kinase